MTFPLNSCHSNKSINDSILMGKIAFDTLIQSLESKEKGNNQFIFTIVEGRDRKFCSFEEFSMLKSSRLYSQKFWPIYLFLNKNIIEETKNILESWQKNILKDWNITIIPIDSINSREELNKFMFFRLMDYIPNDCEYIINQQADGYLITDKVNGQNWEDLLLKEKFAFVGCPWQHNASIIFKEKNSNWKEFNSPKVNIGNGGCSFRNVQKCKEAIKLIKEMTDFGIELAECGNPNLDFPPEDLLFCHTLYSLLEFTLPSREFCYQFSQDPMNYQQYLNKQSIGFHCPINQ